MLLMISHWAVACDLDKHMLDHSLQDVFQKYLQDRTEENRAKFFEKHRKAEEFVKQLRQTDKCQVEADLFQRTLQPLVAIMMSSHSDSSDDDGNAEPHMQKPNSEQAAVSANMSVSTLPKDCSFKPVMSSSELLCASSVKNLILLKTSTEGRLRNEARKEMLRSIKAMQEFSNEGFKNIIPGEKSKLFDNILKNQLKNAIGQQIFWNGFAKILQQELGESSERKTSSQAGHTVHPRDPAKTSEIERKTSQDNRSQGGGAINQNTATKTTEYAKPKKSIEDKSSEGEQDAQKVHQNELTKILKDAQLDESSKFLDELDQNILGIRKESFGLMAKIFQLGAIGCNFPVGCNVFGELNKMAKKAAGNPPDDFLDIVGKVKEVVTFVNVKDVKNAMSNDGIQGVAEEVIKQRLGPEIDNAIVKGAKEAVKK